MNIRSVLRNTSIAACSILVFLGHLHSAAELLADDPDLVSALVFHAAFDDDADAHVVSGDGKIYTAESLSRKRFQPGTHSDQVSLVNAGRHGGALRFSATSEQVLFYKVNELMYDQQNWSGTYSFWLRLDPDKDLKPGFCDPIQITDKKWNDAAIFVDFDKELPRDFRLGMFSNIGHWNPGNVPWEKFPVAERPMIPVKTPPFSNQGWTHVAFAFHGVNPTKNEKATATLYLNGEPVGAMRRSMRFEWNVPTAVMMIGIQYIGDFDDLAVFKRALSPDEIKTLYKLENGVSDLCEIAN